MNVSELSSVPVIDVSPLVNRATERTRVAEQIGTACRECGFFYAVGHGVDAFQTSTERSTPVRRTIAISENVAITDRLYAISFVDRPTVIVRTPRLGAFSSFSGNATP